tara:strand:- start:115 stop:738 length:624 start_codon:yes stop_codon:yes gene_type:complete
LDDTIYEGGGNFAYEKQNKQDQGEGKKSGFMEKEAEFVKSLRDVQDFHIKTCVSLMKFSIVALAMEFVFAIFCIFYFGCVVGSCDNNVICSVHLIKLFQTGFMISTYSTNIKEGQPNHPIGTLNTFIVILLYYGCLYRFIPILKQEESPNLIHFCAVYPGMDLILILVSLVAIRQVKVRRHNLINNKRFKEYTQEAEIALADILYLP